MMPISWTSASPDLGREAVAELVEHLDTGGRRATAGAGSARSAAASPASCVSSVQCDAAEHQSRRPPPGTTRRPVHREERAHHSDPARQEGVGSRSGRRSESGCRTCAATSRWLSRRLLRRNISAVSGETSQASESAKYSMPSRRMVSSWVGRRRRAGGGLLPDLLGRALAVHQADEQVGRGRQQLAAARGPVLEHVPALAPVVVSMELRVWLRPRLELGHPIPGGAEEGVAHRASPPQGSHDQVASRSQSVRLWVQIQMKRRGRPRSWRRPPCRGAVRARPRRGALRPGRSCARPRRSRPG